MKTITLINGRVTHAVSTNWRMRTCCNVGYAKVDYKYSDQHQDKKVTCLACIKEMAMLAARGFKGYNKLLARATGINADHKPTKPAAEPVKPFSAYPLYVYIMHDQEAYLHQGNATTPEEALEELHHIAQEIAPVAVLEVKSCKMYKFSEVKERFCPACGAVGENAADCYCAK